MTTLAPESSPPTSASGNCYFLINVKPDKERIFANVAWLSVLFLAKTDLQRFQRPNFDADTFKNEGQYSLLPRKSAFKC